MAREGRRSRAMLAADAGCPAARPCGSRDLACARSRAASRWIAKGDLDLAVHAFSSLGAFGRTQLTDAEDGWLADEEVPVESRGWGTAASPVLVELHRAPWSVVRAPFCPIGEQGC